MKKVLLAIVLIISTTQLLAQIVNPYSFQLYQYNYSIYSPAFTAFDGKQKLEFIGKVIPSKVGMGYNGALVSYENSLLNNNLGIGFLAFSEQIGAYSFNSTGISLRKSFVFEPGKSISIGSRLNYQHFIQDYLLYRHLSYDPILIDEEPFKHRFLNLETGLSFKINNFYGGATIYNLFNSSNDPKLDMDVVKSRLLLLTGGFKWAISKNLLSDNSLNINTDRMVHSVDFNNNFLIANTIIAGFSISSFKTSEGNSFYSSISGGIKLKNLEIISLIYSPNYPPVKNGREGLSAEVLIRARL